MDTNWLRDLAHESLGDFATSDELDTRLSINALTARHDDEAAFELLRLLAWKLDRFVRRFRTWDLEPFELEDVVQEAYLVFLETIRRWRPRYVDDEPHGYLYYFLKVFPCWLANAVRKWRRPARPPAVSYGTRKSRVETVNDRLIVDDLCRNLNSQEAVLLQLCVDHGLSVPRAARTMGLARRTAYRRWRKIREIGRDYLREAG